jgi:BMFP domain-containing protein YqiC
MTEPQPKLPPDVRHRAAQRAQSTWLTRPSDGWRAVVDAVAEVLAVPFQEAVRRNALNAATVVDVMAERDALKVRVAELEAQNKQPQHEFTCPACGAVTRARMADAENEPLMERVGNRLVQTRKERDVLLARVEVLTTALTDIVSEYSGRYGDYRRKELDARMRRARAVLSAGEVKPDER